MIAHNEGSGPFLNRPRRRKVLTRFHNRIYLGQCCIGAKSGNTRSLVMRPDYAFEPTHALFLISCRIGRRAFRAAIALKISAHVRCAPLGFRFRDGLWFGRQLENCGLLTLTQRRQEHDLAIRKL